MPILTPRNLSLTATVPGDTLDRVDGDCVALAQSSWALVRDWLMACSANNLDGVPYRYVIDNAASDGYFGAAAWQARAFAAYKLLPNLLTGAQRATLDAWFLSCARYHARHLDDAYYGLTAVFPGRLIGDYDNRAKDALTGAMTGVKTHQSGAAISSLATWWNNRRSMICLFAAMVGLHYKDAALIKSAKRYVKEWVTYSVYSDGAQGEWLRNGNYNYVSAGVTYGAYTSALAILLAHWLQATGDNELLVFRTKAGLWGTESTAPKSIWSALDAHISMLDGSQVWYDCAGRPFDQNHAGTFGRMNHASWVLPAIGSNSRYATLRKWADQPAPKIEDPYGLWRGLAGIHQDVRTAA